MLATLGANPACNPICRVCHYKDLDYDSQLARKRAWASEKLAAWRDVLGEIIPASKEERTGYRAKSWMRSEIRDGKLSFGMFRAVQIEGAWKKEFISWDGCPIHLPAIGQTTRRLAEALTHHAPRFSEEALFGIWIGSPHLVVVAREPIPAEVRDLPWSEILDPPLGRAWFHRTSQVGRKVFGRGEILALNGASPGPTHPIRAFRQVAQTLLVNARARAIQALLAPRPEFVLDLYCGTGDLAILLPESVGWIGIEISPDAVAYAKTLRPSNPRAPVHTAFVGSVEQRLVDPRVIEKISGPYSLYLNPPRSGLGPGARAEILGILRRNRPLSIVYLSCSASSLARDLEVLEGEGYRVHSLQPYDFFPQTEHFETLAILERAPTK
jgi:tRNA/tmRNA/rRNA uracil-C5-methylase (TrmA/RlmC/RlmD family)